MPWILQKKCPTFENSRNHGFLHVYGWGKQNITWKTKPRYCLIKVSFASHRSTYSFDISGISCPNVLFLSLWRMSFSESSMASSTHAWHMASIIISDSSGSFSMLGSWDLMNFWASESFCFNTSSCRIWAKETCEKKCQRCQRQNKTHSDIKRWRSASRRIVAAVSTVWATMTSQSYRLNAPRFTSIYLLTYLLWPCPSSTCWLGEWCLFVCSASVSVWGVFNKSCFKVNVIQKQYVKNIVFKLLWL